MTNRQEQEEKLLDPNWVTGFVDGEGCFHVGINKKKSLKLGTQILPEFVIVQHRRDIELLSRFIKFFRCGRVVTNHGDRMAFRVRGYTELSTKRVVFFEKYPLQTRKHNDFTLFREVLLLMKDKKHLTVTGLEEIREITNRMNRKGIRYFEVE